MAEKKSKKNHVNFVDAWLENLLFNGWLCKVKECIIHRPTAQYVTRQLNCPLVGALRSQTTRKERNTKMLWRSEKVVINDDRQSTITDFYSSSNSSVKAEVIWTLKCVMSGCSGRFNDNINETFLAMFPDLKSVLINFSLAITKSSYVINHGLAPYFKNQLEKRY